MTTVDGRTPAPSGDVQNPINNGINYQPQLVIAGFLTNQEISRVGCGAFFGRFGILLHHIWLQHAEVR